jgi:Ca2+-binding EF-hand superfamily protein
MIKILLKDGVISFEEFLIGNLMLKYKDPNISLAILFNIIDIDKNGLLDATEIENIFKAARPVFEYEYEYTPYEDTVALMKKLDMKKDEKISKEAFIHCLINDTNFSRYFKKLKLLNGIKPNQIAKVCF